MKLTKEDVRIRGDCDPGSPSSVEEVVPLYRLREAIKELKNWLEDYDYPDLGNEDDGGYMASLTTNKIDELFGEVLE